MRTEGLKKDNFLLNEGSHHDAKSVIYKGVKIKVQIVADICDLDVDVIVNAANSRLAPGAGVCGAIKKKGGDAIFKECATYLKNRMNGMPLPPGHAMITDGGRLKAKIIHAVGPIWSGDSEKKIREDSQALYETYHNSMKIVEAIKAKSVAFPSISTGIYGFPVKKAAPIAFQSIKNYLDGMSNSDKQLKSICIAIWKDNFDVFANALSETFQGSLPSYAAKRKISDESIKVGRGFTPAEIERAKNKTPNELILPFYQGLSPDSNGRSLAEIWEWDNFQKEACHDYIQWLFPLTEASGFNSRSPVLNETLLQQMKRNSRVVKNIERSFVEMMNFYGFSYDEENNTLGDISNFNLRGAWLNPGNHNFLRLTRILKCLVNFGLEDKAQALIEKLTEIHRKHPEICDGSFKFWKKAAGR